MKSDHEAATVTVGAELWLSLDGQNLAGARRVALLAEVARVGSITQAAKAAGFSYKGAWNAIDDMSNRPARRCSSAAPAARAAVRPGSRRAASSSCATSSSSGRSTPVSSSA